MKTLAEPGDYAEIQRRLKRLRVDSTRRWGRMTAHQMVCHLGDSFQMASGNKPVSSTATLLQRTVVKWIALYAPLPWPAGIPTRPEIDQEVAGTRPADFVADVARLDKLMTTFTTSTMYAEQPPHPIFGRLSRSAWLRWAYLHADHHLRQFGV